MAVWILSEEAAIHSRREGRDAPLKSLPIFRTCCHRTRALSTPLGFNLRSLLPLRNRKGAELISMSRNALDLLLERTRFVAGCFSSFPPSALCSAVGGTSLFVSAYLEPRPGQGSLRLLCQGASARSPHASASRLDSSSHLPRASFPRPSKTTSLLALNRCHLDL